MDTFAQAPGWLAREPKISAQAKATYLALASYANRRRICWPSHATLASNLGCSISTVKRALNELEAEGAIIITRGTQRFNTYALPLERSAAATYAAAVEVFLSRQNQPSRARKTGHQ